MSTVSYHIAPLTAAHAESLCSWRYEPPYDFYRWLSWEEIQAQGREFGDPDIRRDQYAAALDEHGQLVGFAQFFPLLGVTRLGLGLRPDLCGQGSGIALVRVVVAEALRRSPSHEIDLEVHSWNRRAIRVYERAGFAITDTYELPAPGGSTFEVHCMTYSPADA
ncbi:RimJ/RimL family protein N-acetyltransferase [Paenibacillus phyllosphaerae]|uniref:RimJ/RimL family protein N-acetyltransferase n=1 Tax=Paenibacillus phyllosphaerae TaxID=274593 RepID=A0A7W5B512_9BACL|nr:GNAT family protein [Paenibacillus phyllosphaerae]MBB3113796.1 RimJ/RimL family protein N-acetyltransferase [Paenibacillus phyllosphaerae]